MTLGHWYCSLSIKRSTFGYVQADFLDIEGHFLEIHSKVLLQLRNNLAFTLMLLVSWIWKSLKKRWNQITSGI